MPHPQATPPATIARILSLALEHPEWGCVRVAEQLKAEGPGVSSPTVQTILIKHGLGGKPERVRRLEEAHLADGRPLTAEQEALITRANPAFRERAAWPARPGELLVQESFIVGYFDRLGSLYLHAVVDAWNGMAFAELYPAKRGELAVALLNKQVVGFYEERHLRPGAVLTDLSHEYGKYPYQMFLELSQIGHRTTATRGPGKHGAYERFHDEVMEECFKPMERGASVLDIAAPRAALAAWLARYNAERPSPGFPNRGQAPGRAFESYMALPKG
ncbi:MAG: Integrase, catalytic region [Cyanobacteria bacterium RYN_339]|nr:Integrase, catalytic region [Cyanobacteria bacterium RYN_339]